jgi:hypothetical protein
MSLALGATREKGVISASFKDRAIENVFHGTTPDNSIIITCPH